MHISLGAGGGQTVGIRVSFYRIQGNAGYKKEHAKKYYNFIKVFKLKMSCSDYCET